MLTYLVDRRIDGPEEVISALHFTHNYNQTASGQNSEYDVLFGILLECRLQEWIRGPSIADHPLVKQTLSADRLKDMEGNPNARAELLLEGVSTLHIPPLTGLNISVSPFFNCALDLPADVDSRQVNVTYHHEEGQTEASSKARLNNATSIVRLRHSNPR